MSVFRLADLSRFAAVAALALPLAGCMGGGEGPRSGNADLGIALFGNPTNQPTERPTGAQRDYGCPAVDVLEGTAAYRIGQAQASLNDVARECVFGAGSFTLKVGVQGRMLIGAGGRPGTFSVPVRIAVKRGDAVAASRLTRVSVTIPPGEAGASFAHVEEGISLPIGSGDPAEDYEVIVGFDPSGAGVAKARRKR